MSLEPPLSRQEPLQLVVASGRLQVHQPRSLLPQLPVLLLAGMLRQMDLTGLLLLKPARPLSGKRCSMLQYLNA